MRFDQIFRERGPRDRIGPRTELERSHSVVLRRRIFDEPSGSVGFACDLHCGNLGALSIRRVFVEPQRASYFVRVMKRAIEPPLAPFGGARDPRMIDLLVTEQPDQAGCGVG